MVNNATLCNECYTQGRWRLYRAVAVKDGAGGVPTDMFSQNTIDSAINDHRYLQCIQPFSQLYRADPGKI